MPCNAKFGWSLEKLSMEEKQAVQSASDHADEVLSVEIREINARAARAISRATTRCRAEKVRIYRPYKT